MPEFRFRRKKQQNRRTTVNNPDETARQIQAAKKLVKPVYEAPLEEEEGAEDRQTLGVGGMVRGLGGSTGVVEKQNSFVQEREKFFELLKTKYPEQAISLEVGVAKAGENEKEDEGKDSSPESILVGSIFL